jgi:multidrug efflux pump subunit AcrA (membrane-fusion protein)
VVTAQAGVDAAQVALEATLNPPPETVRQQQDAVAAAAAAVASAQAAAQKQRELAKQGNTSTIDLAIYQKKVDQAQLQLDADNDQLAQMQIVAPFDGIVIAANGQPGDRVNAYTAVLTVANPTTLQIAVSVPQDQLPKVAVGQTANIVMDAFPGKNIAGKVTALPSVALASSNQNEASPGAQAAAQQQARGTVVDTSPKVMPAWPGPGAELGQLARVTITVQKKDDVLMIPTSTVNRINNRTFVLLDDNGRQRPVDIQIGIQTDQWTEVLSGLSVGQKVFSRSL